MCYMKSQNCWGGEWPVIVDGDILSACSAHKDGVTKTPTIRLEIHDRGVNEYDTVNKYLRPFLLDEIGDVPGAAIYGHGDVFGKITANIFATENNLNIASDDSEFTHLFIVWDFEDQRVWDRIDTLLHRGVVIESLTL